MPSEEPETWREKRQSSYGKELAVESVVFGCCQIPAGMSHCKLVEAEQTVDSPALDMDIRHSLVVVVVVVVQGALRIPGAFLDTMAVDAESCTTQASGGKREKSSDAVHVQEVVVEAAAVGHDRVGNGTAAADMNEGPEAKVLGTKYAVEDSQEAAGSAPRKSMTVEEEVHIW